MIKAYLMMRGNTIHGGLVKNGRVGVNPYTFPKRPYGSRPKRLFIHLPPVVPTILPKFSQLAELGELTAAPKLPEWAKVKTGLGGWFKVLAVGATPYACAVALLLGQIHDRKSSLVAGQQLRAQETQILRQEQLARVQQENAARGEQVLIAHTYLAPRAQMMAAHRARPQPILAARPAPLAVPAGVRPVLAMGRRPAAPPLLILPPIAAQPAALIGGHPMPGLKHGA